MGVAPKGPPGPRGPRIRRAVRRRVQRVRRIREARQDLPDRRDHRDHRGRWERWVPRSFRAGRQRCRRRIRGEDFQRSSCCCWAGETRGSKVVATAAGVHPPVCETPEIARRGGRMSGRRRESPVAGPPGRGVPCAGRTSGPGPPRRSTSAHAIPYRDPRDAEPSVAAWARGRRSVDQVWRAACWLWVRLGWTAWAN